MDPGVRQAINPHLDVFARGQGPNGAIERTSRGVPVSAAEVVAVCAQPHLGAFTELASHRAYCLLCQLLLRCKQTSLHRSANEASSAGRRHFEAQMFAKLLQEKIEPCARLIPDKRPEGPHLLTCAAGTNGSLGSRKGLHDDDLTDFKI